MRALSPISLNLITLTKLLLPSELVPLLRALALHHPFLHRRRGLIHPGSEGFSAAGPKQAIASACGFVSGPDPGWWW